MSQLAKQRVRMPAMVLIVFSVLALMWTLLNLFDTLSAILTGESFLLSAMVVALEYLVETTSGDVREVLAKMLQDLDATVDTFDIAMSLVIETVSLFLYSFVIYACVQAMNLRMYTVSIIGCVLSAYPCSCPCCCFLAPVGLWLLVILLSSDVKAAFHGPGDLEGDYQQPPHAPGEGEAPGPYSY